MPPPFQRREHHEQIGDAIALVFVIVTRLASRLRGDRRARLDDQLLRGFVEAHERTLRITRPLIDLQHVFHVGDKGQMGVESITRQIVIASRPHGRPQADNFRLEQAGMAPIPPDSGCCECSLLYGRKAFE
jgi:hypothetical protein